MKKDYLSVIYSEERIPRTQYPNQLVDYIVKRFGLKKGDSVLEIGCGRGEFITAFARANFKCHGVDIEPSDACGVEIKKCDASKDKLPFGDKIFDVVFHKSLIEHIYNPTYLMNETERVLKDGGKLIFLTPDWESQMEVFYEDITHCRPYTVLAVSDMLKLWNFKNIVSEKFYQHPLAWNYRFGRFLCGILDMLLPVKQARWLTEKTGIKFFRFFAEAMLLGFGIK